jgi:hypothetical protein
MVIVTFVALINMTAGSSDTILIYKNFGTSGQAAFHSGVVGTGSYDRFPLVCEVALYQNDTLRAEAVVGNWGVIVTGYYTPAVQVA